MKDLEKEIQNTKKILKKLIIQLKKGPNMDKDVFDDLLDDLDLLDENTENTENTEESVVNDDITEADDLDNLLDEIETTETHETPETTETTEELKEPKEKEGLEVSGELKELEEPEEPSNLKELELAQEKINKLKEEKKQLEKQLREAKLAKQSIEEKTVIEKLSPDVAEYSDNYKKFIKELNALEFQKKDLQEQIKELKQTYKDEGVDVQAAIRARNEIIKDIRTKPDEAENIESAKVLLKEDESIYTDLTILAE